MATRMKVSFFGDVAPRSLIEGYRRYRGDSASIISAIANNVGKLLPDYTAQQHKVAIFVVCRVFPQSPLMYAEIVP
jgi:hypothetical protein